MSTVDWKSVTKKLVDQHNKLGVALVACDEETLVQGDWDVANVSSDEEVLRMEGTKLKLKEVRTWLWRQWRKRRAIKRSRAVLWSCIDETDGSSVVGVGALTSKGAVARITKLQEAVTHG
jgi:hypothetical protein